MKPPDSIAAKLRALAARQPQHVHVIVSRKILEALAVEVEAREAAVERIEVEMRARCLPLDGVTIHKIGCACAWADSLRAAREPNRPCT